MVGASAGGGEFGGGELGGGGESRCRVCNEWVGRVFFSEGINSCCVGLSPGVELD